MGQSSRTSDGTPPTPQQTSPRDPLIGAQLGEYVIRERIGEGGMGIVYRGDQPLIGKRVAVKVLRSETGEQAAQQVERLLAEARAVNAIRHRGIIDIFSFGQTPDGRQYFVMEYLEGCSFDVYLGSRGILPLQEALRLAEEILDAVAAAHEAGVIHRDLKPHNIFLVRQPGGGSYVKVLDFGLAKQISNGSPSHTQEGLVVGTPEYMAPEQVYGLTVSPKTDLYAFGILLFLMLTGKLPFTARVPMEYLVQHITQPPTSPLELRPDLPPALAALVLRLLAKAPEERPSMAEVRAELQRLASTQPPGEGLARPTLSGLALPVPPRPLAPDAEGSAKTVQGSKTLPAPWRRSRSRMMIAVGGGLLLLVGAGAFLLSRPSPPPVAPPSVEVRAADVQAVDVQAVPRTEAVVPATEPAPVAAAPVSSSSPNSSKGRPERTALLTRIQRLERRLRSASLPADEREQARRLLNKARDLARDAETSDARRRLSNDLDIWERRYLSGH